MNISYKLKRIRVRLKNLGKKKKLELDDVQQKAYNIVIKLIGDKDSELMYDISDGRRCIEHLDTYVSISKNHLLIINENGDYYYDYIDDVIKFDISEKFDKKVSRKINSSEQKSKLRIKKNLDFIYDNISKE